MSAEYLKGRDQISSSRLNYFGQIMRHVLGYNLHPIVREGQSAGKRLQIADFGAQTANWAIAVAEEHEAAEVHGFDLSNYFFPPTAWLPPNVTLHQQDVYLPFAAPMLEQFDVVHIRLFMNLSAEQIQKILASALALLRPGGFVQWVEPDKEGLSVNAASPDLSTTATQAFLEVNKHPFPNYDSSWVRKIAEAMRAAGLVVMADERITTRPSLFPQFNDLHYLALLDVPKGLSSAIDTFKEQHMSTLLEECRQGVAIVDTFVAVVGQKAGS